MLPTCCCVTEIMTRGFGAFLEGDRNKLWEAAAVSPLCKPSWKRELKSFKIYKCFTGSRLAAGEPVLLLYLFDNCMPWRWFGVLLQYHKIVKESILKPSAYHAYKLQAKNHELNTYSGLETQFIRGQSIVALALEQLGKRLPESQSCSSRRWINFDRSIAITTCARLTCCYKYGTIRHISSEVKPRYSLSVFQPLPPYKSWGEGEERGTIISE